MSYASVDSSVHSGNPIELFQFFAENNYYRYANYDVDVTADNKTWESVIISRERFSIGSDLNRSSVNITTGLTTGIVDLFMNRYPEGAVQAWIYRMHLSAPDELRLLWEGEITAYSMTGKQATLKGEVPEVSLQSLGLRRMYQRTCPYPLYGAGCWVSKNSYSAQTVITSVSGADLEVSYGSCHLLSGGFLEVILDGHKKLRYIEHGSGNSIRVKQEADWLTVGLSITVFQGCARTIQACAGQFNNSDNFGGFHVMPVDNLYNTQVY